MKQLWQLSSRELLPVIQETMRRGGVFPLVVTGGSMTPTLKEGRDTVYLQQADAACLRRGDLVLFQRKNGQLVLHRILRRSGSCLVMNGDAQPWTEEIHLSQVLAVVSRVERKGKLMDCDRWGSRAWVFIWRPTRRVRPLLFRTKAALNKGAKLLCGKK